MTSDITIDQCERIMRRVEAEHDAAGWLPPHAGASMVFYCVVDRQQTMAEVEMAGATRSIGAPVRSPRLAAYPILGHAQFAQARRLTGRDEPETLSRWAHDIALSDAGVIARLLAGGGAAAGFARVLPLFQQLLRQPGIVGFLVCFEGYGREVTVPDMLTELTTGTYRPAREHPGAVEIRTVQLIDETDTPHMLRRIRPADGDGRGHAEFLLGVHGGRVGTSLRIFMDYAAGRAPATADEYALRYPGPVDATLDVVNRYGLYQRNRG